MSLPIVLGLRGGRLLVSIFPLCIFILQEEMLSVHRSFACPGVKAA